MAHSSKPAICAAFRAAPGKPRPARPGRAFFRAKWEDSGYHVHGMGRAAPRTPYDGRGRSSRGGRASP